MRRAQRTLRIAAICAAALAALLIVAPAALAADGEGLAGRVTDKTITFFCFGVILFFPVLVVVLSTIQGRLEANKDRRRYELERFGE
jgi:putative copper export protein